MPGLYLMNISGIMLLSLDKVTMSQAKIITHTTGKGTPLSQELWEGTRNQGRGIRLPETSSLGS